ncbi:MAG: hypothetical protein KDN20_12910 [Verrucomicrobiae bacterium]|nr:hypothetical protein [Verrucomicrobiae bacterium]
MQAFRRKTFIFEGLPSNYEQKRKLSAGNPAKSLAINSMSGQNRGKTYCSVEKMITRSLIAILGLFGSAALSAENTVYLADEKLKLCFPSTWAVDTHLPNHFNSFLILVVNPEPPTLGPITHEGRIVPVEGTVVVSMMTLPGTDEFPWEDTDAEDQVRDRGEWKVKGPAAEKHDKNWPENRVLSALRYHQGLKAWLGVSVKWNDSDTKGELEDQESEMDTLLGSVLDRIDRDNDFGTESGRNGD